MAEAKVEQTPKEAEVVETATAKPAAKKGKSPFFWLALVGCGCLILISCILGGIAIMCFTSDEFKTEFEKSYCQSLEDQNIDPDEDPFGICK